MYATLAFSEPRSQRSMQGHPYKVVTHKKTLIEHHTMFFNSTQVVPTNNTRVFVCSSNFQPYNFTGEAIISLGTLCEYMYINNFY